MRSFMWNMRLKSPGLIPINIPKIFSIQGLIIWYWLAMAFNSSGFLLCFIFTFFVKADWLSFITWLSNCIVSLFYPRVVCIFVFILFNFFLLLPKKVSFEMHGHHLMMLTDNCTSYEWLKRELNRWDKVQRITPVYPDITHNSLCSELCGKWDGAAISFHL